MAMSNGWRVAMEDGQTQVTPVDDLKPHESGEGCWCHPFWEDDILVHNSMDKREEWENGRRFA